MIISIINQKGGVGKTTTAVNLGAALAERGQRVLLVDLDAQHNASSLCGTRETTASMFDVLVDEEEKPITDIIRTTPIENLHLAPGHRALAGLESALLDVVGREMLLKEALAPVRNRYDAILIDNGPTLGIGPAMSLCAADIALVPLQCEHMALDGLAQVLKTITAAQRRTNPNLQKRILLTMLDRRITSAKDIANAVQQRFANEVCQTIISRSARLDTGTLSVLQHSPSSSAAQDYRALAAEFLGESSESEGANAREEATTVEAQAAVFPTGTEHRTAINGQHNHDLTVASTPSSLHYTNGYARDDKGSSDGDKVHNRVLEQREPNAAPAHHVEQVEHEQVEHQFVEREQLELEQAHIDQANFEHPQSYQTAREPSNTPIHTPLHNATALQSQTDSREVTQQPQLGLSTATNAVITDDTPASEPQTLKETDVTSEQNSRANQSVGV